MLSITFYRVSAFFNIEVFLTKIPHQHLFQKCIIRIGTRNIILVRQTTKLDKKVKNLATSKAPTVPNVIKGLCFNGLGNYIRISVIQPSVEDVGQGDFWGQELVQIDPEKKIHCQK